MATTHVELIMPNHTNAQDRLFGGQLVAWIDVVAAVEARRHAQNNVTTVAIDHLYFLGPAFVNDTVVLKAQLTWSGRTSMEVRVDTFVERLDGSQEQINRAFLVFVAIDRYNQPVQVPAFEPQSEEQKQEYQAALQRKAARKARKS